ncbi:MAG: dihydrolipoamide acetyltransferase family protein [Spirochaetaceae bacterium]|nr:dihydrolipoamide acetyltransferase family protein [Spirochaetaceae bacterium]
MAVPVRPPLAQPGETRTIIAWTREIGDPVSAGETICEVETDKATVAIESQADGVLVAKLFDVGAEIPEDGPIAMVGSADEIGAAETIGAADDAEPGDAAPPAPAEPPAPAPAPAPQPESAAPRRLAVSPRARKRAAELSVTLAGLTGTGPGGRIIERDVLAAGAAAPAQATAAPAPAAAEQVGADHVVGDQVIPVRGARRLVAERMHASLRDTAQLTMTSYADATRLLQLRAAFKTADPQFEMSDVTLNDLLLFAVARTLTEHPELNATCRDGEGGLEIVRSAAVHLAFAVDTPRVLMVPVIRDAAGLRVRELSTRAADLAERCREGSITPAELAGGTFTVSNLGSFGVESFTPILNPPQAAILGVGAVTWRPIGEREVQQQVALSLTIDHRLIDGAPAARFLQTLCARIAELDVLLAL